jgi:hypothetical protein
MRTKTLIIYREPFQLQKKKMEPAPAAGWQQRLALRRSKGKREYNLYELSRKAAAHSFGRFEMVVFLFVGVLASAATFASCMEFFQAVHDGALERTVELLLSR